MGRHAYVHRATLTLHPGVDPAAPGAAVTVALCGHWVHEPPCRWPHHSEQTEGHHGVRQFRTIFVCDEDDESAVRDKVDTALKSAADWEVVESGPGEVAPGDRPLAEKLVAGPHL